MPAAVDRHPGTGRRTWRAAALSVFVVLVAIAVAAFAVSRRVVHDQEQRLLTERGRRGAGLVDQLP